MEYISRLLKSVLIDKLKNDKRIVFLLGARQVGKTTLARAVMDDVADGQALFLNGEDPRTAEVLSS